MLLPHRIFMYCRKCGVELRPQASSCRYCGTGVEDYFDDKAAKAEADWTHLTILLQPEQNFPCQPSDWPDASSAWPGNGDAIILPIAPEPCDCDPDETAEDQFPLYLPIPPPIWSPIHSPVHSSIRDNAPVQPEPGYSIVPIEQAILIPIEEVLARNSGATIGSTGNDLPPEPAEAAFFTYLLRDETGRSRQRLVSSLLLLLLAVILLFVFAYLAQK